MVIAALSNGGGYANLFQEKEDSGFLAAVLAELWDFDTRVSSAEADYLDSKLGKPIRGYYQNPKFHPAAYFHCTLNDSSWQNYYNNPIPSEIPPRARELAFALAGRVAVTLTPGWATAEWQTHDPHPAG